MAALGFRDAEAGGVLGKTRQAVNSGLRGGRSDYFAAGDIINLMIDARTSGRVFDEAAIEAYVEKTRGVGDRDRIRMALSNAGDLELTTTRWSEVWIILPDFRHLKRDSGRDRNSAYRTVVSLPREQPTARFRYVCASPIERELLRGDVDGGVALNHGRVRITDAVAAASQMTMVIGDPYERAAVFVPTKAGFTRIAYYETEYTVKNLLTLFPFLEEAWEDESHPAI